jgi:hypothetical protein
MATQVNEQSIELTRDSLDGLSERSSTSAASGNGGGPVSETAARRFSAVHWETPPDDPESDSEESPDQTARGDTPAAPMDGTARQRFADVCWEEPPDDPEPDIEDGQSEWGEKMKLDNFFEDAGW